MTPVAGRSPFPPRRVLALGLPLAVGMGGHALFNLVDLWIVAPLGAAALAAVTVASLVNTVPMVLAQGVSDGSVAIIARRFGAGDRAGAADATRQSMLFMLLLAVLLGGPPALAARPLAALAGASGDSLEPATDCLAVLSWGSGTMFLLMQVSAALRAAGFGRAPAVLLVAGNALNALLSYALVRGEWGLPALGVTGAPWGTVVARGAMAALGVVLLAGSPLAFRWRGGGLRWTLVARLLRLGLPVAGQWVVRVGAVLVVLAVVGGHGADAQAAYGIAGRLDTLALFSTVGWGSAAATAVGQGLGAGDRRSAARGAWFAAALGAATMGAFAAWFVADTAGILGVVTGGGSGRNVDRAALETVAGPYLRTVAMAYPALGVSVVLSMALAGAGNVRRALLLEFLLLWCVQAPLALRSSAHLQGVWNAVAWTNLALAAGYVALFASGRWGTGGAAVESDAPAPDPSAHA